MTGFFTNANILAAVAHAAQIDTLTVIGADKEYVNATIEVTVIKGEKMQTHTINIRLIEEESGWRLASTTFAKYNEYQDIYNELQKG